MSRFSTIATALVVATVACGKSRPNADSVAGAVLPVDTSAAAATPMAPPTPPPFTIAVADKNGTQVLTDAAGRALYVAEAKPTCETPDCKGFTAVAGKGAPGDPKVKAELIGVVTAPDGTTQITYATEPLYMFSGDMAAGDTKGQAVKANGTTYHLVSPEGKKVTAKAKS